MRNRTSMLTTMHRIALTILCLSLSTVSWATTRGPDAGNYTATDATVYSFVDISGSGGGASLLAGTDDGTAPLTLPFAFRFYGQPYSILCVSANGAAYFVPNAAACGGLIDFGNVDLTTAGTPNDLPAIFPFWSDLSFQEAGGGSVFYQVIGSSPTRKFVVQWNNAYPASSPNPVTFQAVLFEGTNQILFQYKTVDLGDGNPATKGRTATIGIRNAGAPASEQLIEWSTNVAVVGNESALLFAGPSAATPVITWNNPADITYGTALGAAQLNATADVAGTFVYTPAAGTVLDAGLAQTLSVTFTPTDTDHYTQTTKSVPINVNKAASVAGMTVVPLTAGALQPIVVIGNASPLAALGPGAVGPAGSMLFKEGSVVIGTATFTAGNITGAVINGLSIGTHLLHAEYLGNQNWLPSTSPVEVPVTIRPAAASTFTFLIQWTNPAASGQQVLLSAVVIPLAGSTVPTGTVQFTDGATSIGSAALVNGVATIAVNSLNAGAHLIGARYLGSAAFASSTASPVVQTIYDGTRPTSTSLSLAATPNPAAFGEPVTFTATITATAGAPSGTVVFFADDLIVGTATISNVGGTFKAVLPMSNLTRGAHVITASYAGNGAFGASNSAPVLQIVQ